MKAQLPPQISTSIKKAASIFLLALGFSSPALPAATYTYTGVQGTSDIWRTTFGNATGRATWTDGVSSNLAWPSQANGAENTTAVFGGTPGYAIRVSGGDVNTIIYAYGLVLNTSGWSFTSNEIKLGAGGADMSALTSGTITFGASNGGSLGLTADQTWKLGSGTTVDATSVDQGNQTVTRVAVNGMALALNTTGAAISTVNINVSGSGILAKTGTGTVVLGARYAGYNAGASANFTGSIEAREGTLILSTAVQNTVAGVTVKNGGRLGGTVATPSTSLIDAATTVEGGGILLAGTGTTGATLTISGNLTLNDNSQIELTLGPSLAHSTLKRNGGTWVFDSNQGFVLSGTGFTLGTYDNVISGLTGTEAGLNTIGSWVVVAGGVQGIFTYDNAGGVDLQVTAVPEPDATALVIAGGLLVLAMRRKSRRIA